MNLKNFRPLLAAKAPEDLSTLRYPMLVSPKLDGIRAVMLGGRLLSRTLKPIPNIYTRTLVEMYANQLEGFDGELIVGEPNDEHVFARTTSAVMSRGGGSVFGFYVFDVVAKGDYSTRTKAITCAPLPSFVKVVPQIFVTDIATLNHYESHYINCGYEGVILRDPKAEYKFGRSTVKEQALLKVKRFDDDEAMVIDFEEQMHNDNAKEKDERGYAKRSHKQANLKGAGTLGALICESERYTDVFNIGTGFDAATRKYIWTHRPHFRGKLVRFKFQRVGTIDAPRCPVFQGWRDPKDM